MPEMRRSIKDSVFTLMFKEPKYALQLYQALHPEDKDVTEADCKIVTLENILTVGQYNDLGLLVRDMLLLLTEAQSTFSVNITPRLLMYVANSYKEYVDENNLDLYGGKPLKLPRPELYVVYTGPKFDVPETIHLSDLYEGTGDVDLRVHVVRRTGTGDILDQYVRFCEIVDEKRKQYGTTEKTVEAILKQCREENILIPFLLTREKEVRDIMVTLFSQERALEIYSYNLAKDAKAEGKEEGRAEGKEEGRAEGMEKGRAEGMEKGRAEGMEKGIRAMVLTLKEIAMAPAAIAQTLAKQFGLSQDVAEEKVQQYWS